MSDYTLFFNPLLQGFTTNAPTSFYSRYSDDFNPTVIFPMTQKKIQSITLDLAQTYTLTPANLTVANGCIIIAKVVGAARLKVVGTDNGGTVTGYLPTYGTDLLPGYINLSTFNATSFELLGQADGTVIEIFLGMSGDAVGFTSTFDYIFDVGFAVPHTVTVTYFKVGRQVTFFIPSLEALGAATGVQFLTGTGSIPASLIPSLVPINTALIATDNSTNTAGFVEITALGKIEIFKTVTATAFGDGHTIGWDQFTTTYLADA